MARDAPEPTVRCSALVVICLLTSMPPLTMEIYIPSLPVLEEDLHTTTTLVLLTITVYTAAFSVMQLVLGPASDVYGRRKLLLISLGLYVASCIVNALSPTIELMLAPRVIQGSTSAAALIIGQAMLRDLLSIKKRENVTKWMAVVRSSSPMLAPVLGSLLAATLGWRSTFWALAGFGGLILLSSFHLLPESLPKERRQPKFSPYNLLHSVCFLMRRRDFLCWAVPEALGFSAFFVWIATSSYILQGFYGISVATFGLLYCLCFLGATAGSFATSIVRGRLKLSPHGTYTLGLTLQSLCALTLGLLSFTPLFHQPSPLSEVVLQSVITIYIFGRALCMVQAQVQSLEPFPTRAASAAGLMGALRSGGVATVSALSGQMLRNGDDSPGGPSRAICVLALLAHGAYALLRPRIPKPPACVSEAVRAAGDSASMIEPAESEMTEEAMSDLEAAHKAAKEEAVAAAKQRVKELEEAARAKSESQEKEGVQ